MNKVLLGIGTRAGQKSELNKPKGGNRDWTGDLSICSRMLYHWAIPPCIQSGDEVSILSNWELTTIKTCGPRAIWYLRFAARSFQKYFVKMSNRALFPWSILFACIEYLSNTGENLIKRHNRVYILSSIFWHLSTNESARNIPFIL